MARLSLKQFGLVYHSITQYVKYRFNRRFPEGTGKYALFFVEDMTTTPYTIIAKLRGITGSTDLLVNKQLCIDYYGEGASGQVNPCAGKPAFGKATTDINHMELEIYDTRAEAEAAVQKITSSLRKWVEIKEI